MSEFSLAISSLMTWVSSCISKAGSPNSCFPLATGRIREKEGEQQIQGKDKHTSHVQVTHTLLVFLA